MLPSFSFGAEGVEYGRNSAYYALADSGGTGPSGGVSGVTGTANQISAVNVSGAVTLALAPPSPGPTAAAYANPSSVTVDALGRVTAITAGAVPGSGNLNCGGFQGSATLTVIQAVQPGNPPEADTTFTFDAGASAVKAVVSASYVIYNTTTDPHSFRSGIRLGAGATGSNVNSGLVTLPAQTTTTVTILGYVPSVTGSTVVTTFVDRTDASVTDPGLQYSNANIIVTWGGV